VKACEKIPFILVGNKSDLHERRQVSPTSCDSRAKAWGVPFVETSAKTRENVDKAFFDLIRIIREDRIRAKASSSSSSDSNKKRSLSIVSKLSGQFSSSNNSSNSNSSNHHNGKENGTTANATMMKKSGKCCFNLF